MMIPKLKARIAAPWRRIDAIIRAIMVGRGKIVGRVDVVESLRRARQPRGQWHRWYQIDQRIKRRARAIKQNGGLGVRIAGWDLPRWMAPIVRKTSIRRKTDRRKWIDGQKLLWRH